MKIRYDFVTNSSSTSFIIISDGEFNLRDFIDAVGITSDSQFNDIYSSLFEAFKDDMKPARQYYARDNKDGQFNSFDDYILECFQYGKEILPKILEAEANGKKVYLGSLSSDNGWIEGFFCTDEFIIDSPKLYIDGRENSW